MQTNFCRVLNWLKSHIGFWKYFAFILLVTRKVCTTWTAYWPGASRTQSRAIDRIVTAEANRISFCNEYHLTGVWKSVNIIKYCVKCLLNVSWKYKSMSMDIWKKPKFVIFFFYSASYEGLNLTFSLLHLKLYREVLKKNAIQRFVSQ